MFVQWENLHPEMYSYCVLGEALVNDEENRSLYSQFVEEVERQEATFSVWSVYVAVDYRVERWV